MLLAIVIILLQHPRYLLFFPSPPSFLPSRITVTTSCSSRLVLYPRVIHLNQRKSSPIDDDNMPPTTRPKLPQLKTPVSSTFPSELSALSAKSPLPGYADFLKQEDGIKTPITPPLAYTDFLKSMASPPITGGTDRFSGRSTPTSAPSTAPSTASSEHSSCSCNCETHKSISPTTENPPTPAVLPTSAPLPRTDRVGRVRIPPSPAYSIDSPLSASATSAVRSPFSARSPFDWDFKSKGHGRHFDIKSPRITKPSVRQVREIVTRTVTYTPRMSPAPKGKRRKIERD